MPFFQKKLILKFKSLNYLRVRQPTTHNSLDEWDHKDVEILNCISNLTA